MARPKAEIPGEVRESFRKALPLTTDVFENQLYGPVLKTARAGQVFLLESTEGAGKFYIASENLAQYLINLKARRDGLISPKISSTTVEYALADMRGRKKDPDNFFGLYTHGGKKFVYLFPEERARHVLGRFFQPKFLEDILSIRGIDDIARRGLVRVFAASVARGRTLNIALTSDNKFESAITAPLPEIK